MDQCEQCNGSGEVPIGEHVVTLEMAMDVGDRSLEGTTYEVEYGPCPACEGSGVVSVGNPVDRLQESDRETYPQRHKSSTQRP